MAESLLKSQADGEFISSELWSRLRDALLDIARQPFDQYSSTVHRLLRSSARALGCQRVSLWLFEPGGMAIRCEAIVDGEDFRFRSGETLSSDDAPMYFAAVENLLTLAVRDAYADPRTRELADSYLRPLNIGAMLDVPVRMFGEMVGIVCHEHIGGTRSWEDQERIFSCAIAALCSQLLEHERLRDAEHARQRAEFYDATTGLPNRALFLDRVRQRIKAGKSCAVLAMDIDRFGALSQAIGADATDLLLRRVGERLAALVEPDRIARIGNDEFAIMATGNSPLVEANRIAREIQLACQDAFDLEGQQLMLTISIGIAPDSVANPSARGLLRDATLALAAANRAGQGECVLFQQGMDTRVRERLALEMDIREGMQRGEFALFLQPVVDARDGRLLSAEALLRWRHPGRGVLSPGLFIEVAEEAGLLPALHRPLFRALLGQLAQWRSRRGWEHLRISVNFSYQQFVSRGFIEDLKQSLRGAGLPHEAIQVEITENTVLSSDAKVTAVMRELAEAGFRLALDDFGTGYASITHLADLPLHTVKLDQSFVGKALADERVASIIRSLIGMAHALNLVVIAEGVELEAHREMLALAGCDELQGYLIGRPIDERVFEERWLGGG